MAEQCQLFLPFFLLILGILNTSQQGDDVAYLEFATENLSMSKERRAFSHSARYLHWRQVFRTIKRVGIFMLSLHLGLR